MAIWSETIHALVDHIVVEFLGNEAYIHLRSGKMGSGVDAEYIHRPAGFTQQETNNPNRGGFASAIGAQQREKISRLNLQRDSLERLESVSIRFGEISNG